MAGLIRLPPNLVVSFFVVLYSSKSHSSNQSGIISMVVVGLGERLFAATLDSVSSPGPAISSVSTVLPYPQVVRCVQDLDTVNH
jgi:hypothetical protein